MIKTNSQQKQIYEVWVNMQFFFIEHYDVGLNAIRGTTHYLDVRMIVHVGKNILEKTCLIKPVFDNWKQCLHVL